LERRRVFITTFGLVTLVDAFVGDSILGVDVLKRYTWAGSFPHEPGQVGTMSLAPLDEESDEKTMSDIEESGHHDGSDEPEESAESDQPDDSGDE
jgi:hypothetical protein